MHLDIFMLARLALCGLGLAGLVVARHIHVHKQEGHTPLVCPIHFNCAAVVHSDYSKFLGVPVEIFGMVYYVFIALSFGLLLALPGLASSYFLTVIILAALTAFLFSLYLSVVQVFALREACFWCYISSFISVLIFLIIILTYNPAGIIAALVH